MKNFLKETLEAIKNSGHKKEDVMFIGSANGEYRMNWNCFVANSNFEYDNGFGASAIATDLIIYFKDHTYIQRGEYDGSEWWEYNVPKIFNETDTYKPFKILGGDKYFWETVEEMNNKDLYDDEGYLKIEVER